MLNRDTVLLARLDNGEHVQIGRADTHERAHDLFSCLDGEITGFSRDKHGSLKWRQPTRHHVVNGVNVSFYRLRQVDHEFGDIRRVPVSAVRSYLLNRRNTVKMISKSTPSGVKRPKTGKYSTYRKAATVAKGKNVEHGRGYRALKALDGSYGVIFRPKVASNKQRRNREVV